MPYIADENEKINPGYGSIDFWIVMSILALAFAVIACFFAPRPDPPTHIRNSDPYWYSGE